MKKIILIIAAVIGLTVLLFAAKGSNDSNTQNKDKYLTPVANLRDVHGLAVDVADPSKVWIASHTGLHLLKDDKNLYLVGSGRDDYMGFSAHPTDANTFFTSGHPTRGGNLGFQKSTDAGRTWEKVSDGLNGPVDFHSMAIDRINPDLVYGIHRGQMQKSTDGGNSWDYVNSAQQNVMRLTAGAKQNTLYTVTQNGLQVSKDQGDTWAKLPSPDSSTISLAANPSNEKELLAYSHERGFTKSTDGGQSWQDIGASFGKEVALYTDYATSNPTIVYTVTQSLNIYKSTDSGKTWSKVK